MSVYGVDQKWQADWQNDAFDPTSDVRLLRKTSHLKGDILRALQRADKICRINLQAGAHE
jgi:hypothetical protein